MTLKNNHGKGNRKAQQKRKRERMKLKIPKQSEKMELIDGNFSFYVVAECKIHGGYLTQGLVDTHRCEHRHCSGFRKVRHEKSGSD